MEVGLLIVQGAMKRRVNGIAQVHALSDVVWREDASGRQVTYFVR